MKIHTRTAIFLLAALAAVSCRKDENRNEGQDTGTVRFTVSAAGMAGDSGNKEDMTVKGIYGFRFEDGMLAEMFEGITPGNDGTFRLEFLNGRKGKIIFWANAAGTMTDSGFEAGTTSLEEFMEHTASAEEMTSDGITMTASAMLDDTGTDIPLEFRRSVARIDLRSEFSDTEVRKITVRNICGSGRVNEYEAAQDGDAGDLVMDFGDRPFEGGTETLFYVCEQPYAKHEIEADVIAGGAWRKLRSTIEGIKRNTVYTVTVFGNGADTGISVSGDGWETGDGTASGQIPKGTVDTEASVLSEGVRVNEGRDTVFLPYSGCDIRLVLKAEKGTGMEIKGSIEGVGISRSSSESMTRLESLDITGAHRFPGKTDEYIYIDILSGEDLTGRVVLVAEANPVNLVGDIVLDENGECHFGRYIDGNLGTITVPEGKTVNVYSTDGKRPWIRVVETEENTFRIDGGWKPNDPEADGRIQTAELVVSDMDGNNQEKYTVSRRNWGLPVININGTWWCKYNLRGNVKDFEDQISIADDPVKEGNLAEYLAGCSDEEFLRIAGDQYQAGNREGLKIKAEGSSFVFEGFSGSAGNDFGTVDPESMAPDGYMIPDYDDYRFFTWSENSNMGYGANEFNNKLGQRLSYTILERRLTADGADYGTVHIYDFVHEGMHWTLAGLGHQYNSTDIAKMSIIFATSGKAGKSWMMEGYDRASGKGNWYKYVSQNTVKTRMIRCVKTPVEYIYE